MKRIFLALIGIALSTMSLAQLSLSLSSMAIPERLRENANSVKRLEEVSFEVLDVGKAVYKVHQVVTILNKQADEGLVFNVMTDKFRSLEDCNIKVYDSVGRQIAHFKRKDLSKQAAGGDLVSDDVINYLTVATTAYPVTVEYEYEFRYAQTLFYPYYDIQDKNEAVEKSSFTLKVPKELGVRFKTYHTSTTPEVTEDGKAVSYRWEADSLSAVKPEEESAEGVTTAAAIIFAPNKFSVARNEGDMSTWQTFGFWEKNLINGLDELPADRVTFFKELVKNATSEREKVAIVYKYLQQNFRYVSIQLGIGGWQPFPAKFTDEKKYGDCKGLSFYTYSVLKALGIRSCIALVNADYNRLPVDPNFPVPNFNHVILCVPQPKDSVWLDCTVRTADFNDLGSFTENRYALLITETGGALVATPASRPSKNRLATVTTINLAEDGSGQTISLLTLTGDARFSAEHYLDAKSDDQKEFIINGLGFKQPDNFALQRINPENSEIRLDIEKIPQFTAGPKMFLSPRLYRFWGTALPSCTQRKTDYFFHFAMDKADSTTYQLPSGYSVEVLPKPVDKKCGYASYSTSYQYDAAKNQLTTTARLVLNTNRIPAAHYGEVKSFFDEVLSDQSQKMVIKKN